jgi:hypothetical protein
MVPMVASCDMDATAICHTHGVSGVSGRRVEGVARVCVAHIILLPSAPLDTNSNVALATGSDTSLKLQYTVFRRLGFWFECWTGQLWRCDVRGREGAHATG